MPWSKWGLSTCVLMILSGCQPWYQGVDSKTLSEQKVQAMAQRIDQLYPNLDGDEKQQILGVALRAMDNMLRVKGGSFEMGDFGMKCRVADTNRLNWDPNDHPCLTSPSSQPHGAMYVHPVTLTTYYLSKYKTTFRDFEILRKAHDKPLALGKGYHVKRNTYDYKGFMSRHGKNAAYTKTWQSTKDYWHWLGHITDEPFDLPTEAQWEYAARSRGKHYYFATNNNYLQYANDHYRNPKTGRWVTFDESSANTSSNPSNVDRYPPNPFGFYDMQSVVAEWVNDWYAKDYYKVSPVKNPTGPSHGQYKVTRGGGNMPTFGRSPEKLTLPFYSELNSFRCAIQSSQL
ncbi:formylglycine-generating enzyme family protein [Celerinatantimonas diazotrophica]|uniref:Formylglycine-generating enzyme required for sulfatase activity n=1 Tax=Celerinatantimonas diazotrophica TaxID=412034 RepID=A0A4R1KEZ0_9GAMM|nr:SUMF1/EgtB/PvdO family nonheme iron enzyme [Celerinatantimonas diazotrophica]TCK62717.1 formylglycine-generating enzyme required for sulfatase activity [Celerinatantimonas diazotrophica]CAG9298347.1 hypothetical protein CEDIAZO_03547 [Celerinatantimonas diazotrophica]